MNAQTFFEPCFDKFSCIKKFAVRFGHSAMMFEADDKEQKITLSRLNQINAQEMSLVQPSDAAESFDIKLGDGSTIAVVSGVWQNRRFMNVKVMLANGDAYGSMGGICNTIGGPDNLLRCAGGQTTTNPDQFGDSWKVPDTDNIFMGHIVPPAELPSFDTSLTQNQCTAEPVCPLPPVTSTTEVPVSTTPAYTSSTPAPTTTSMNCNDLPLYQPTSTQVTLPTEQVEQPDNTSTPAIPYGTAVDHCTTVIIVDGCSSVADRDFYLQSCAQDYSATGLTSFVEMARQSYLASCRLTTKYMQGSPDENVRNEAEQVRSQCGLGAENKCVNDCSGRGTCTANGCMCEPGFGGKGCSIDLNQLPYEAPAVSPNNSYMATPPGYTASNTTQDTTQDETTTSSPAAKNLEAKPSSKGATSSQTTQPASANKPSSAALVRVALHSVMVVGLSALIVL
jgi:hypothetical protein